GDRIRVRGRIPVQGQPAALIANRAGSRLYVALDTTSQVAVYDTARNSLIEKFNAVAPANFYDDSKLLGGANTNALALTASARIPLFSNGGLNEIAVVRLSKRAIGPETGSPQRRARRRRDRDNDAEEGAHSAVVGLVPSGWYPTSVTTSSDGAKWYIVNS